MNITANKQLAAIITLLSVAMILDGLDGIKESLREDPPVVDLSPHCAARITGVTCTFTNVMKEPAKSCMVGVVVKKGSDGHGHRATSVVMCTGTLEQYETKQMTVPWEEGSPKNVCKDGESGPFDWDLCSFATTALYLTEGKK